ncbi:MAG: hypothetical protein K0S32_2837 [Bacteroidetes bacterium]|jgi:hypothetical protein|nr:hypothetical protein [Bacteroidota bacterium]
MKYIVLLMLFFAISEDSFGQSDSVSFTPKYRRGVKYEIVTGQNKISGFLVKETAETVSIEDRRTGQLHEIKKSAIISMKPVSASKTYQKDFLDENAHAHTYIFSNSSYCSGSPESYVNYQWFVVQNINYGITEYLDISVNTIFLYPVSLGVKLKFKVAEDTYIGGNTFFSGNINDRISPNSFFGYGALARITHGTSNTNFSFSGGVLGLNSDFFTMSSKFGVVNLPFGNFSYCNRFQEKWAVCAEAWYFPQAEIGFAGIGFKFMRSKHSAWTFGCFTNVNAVNNQLVPNFKTTPIPYIGLTNNLFGK